MDNSVQHIKNLIEKNDIKTAIKELGSIIKSDKPEKELIINSARFKELESFIRMGIINFEDSTIEKNKIRNSLISLVNEIENSDNSSSFFNNLFYSKNRWNIFIFVTIIVLISIFIVYSNRTITTGIKGDNNDNNKIEIHK